MGGKVLRTSALYPRHNLKRMDIIATVRMVSVLWYYRPLQKPANGGSGNAERVTDLHVADGSEGRVFESRGQRFFLWQKINPPVWEGKLKNHLALAAWYIGRRVCIQNRSSQV
jgi:hypothetical protein